MLHAVVSIRATRLVKASVLAGFLLATLGMACGKGQTAKSPTAPSPAPPTVSETFAGRLPVGGSKFYSFSIAVYGTVNATLVSVSGDSVPPDVTLALGVGTPYATICNSTRTNVSTSGTTLVTAIEDAGVYCVNIVDVGNLPAPANFVVRIDHP